MRIIRSTASALVLAASLVGTSAWADTGTSGTTHDKGTTSTQAPAATQVQQGTNAMRLKAGDERFLKDAFDHLSEGVAIGQLAVRQGQSAEVKKIGHQMVTDDTSGLDKLKSLAQKDGLTLPQAPPQDQMKAVGDLSKLSGKQFDDAFLAQVKTRNNNALNVFSQESKTGKNDSLKTYASDQIPVIRGQIDQVKTGVTSMQKGTTNKQPTNNPPPAKKQPAK
jgi:predicted outer membrane protein